MNKHRLVYWGTLLVLLSTFPLGVLCMRLATALDEPLSGGPLMSAGLFLALASYPAYITAALMAVYGFAKYLFKKKV